MKTNPSDTTKICPFCKTEFEPRHRAIKYCDDICKSKSNQADLRERRKLGIKSKPKKTREQVYIPDAEVIFKNSFLLRATA